MYSDKKTARIVGILYLTVMISFTIGMVLISSVVKSPVQLSNIYPNRIYVIIGVMFELIEVAAVIGIVVMMFPILKKHNESLTLGYAFFRILESVMLVVGAISAFLMVTLSQTYLKTAPPDASYFQILSSLFMSMREGMGMTILSVFYSFGAFIFYGFLYKSRLIPRFISIWGFVAAVLVFAGAPVEAFGPEKGSMIATEVSIPGIAMGLNEIFLGVWLIVKGFNPSANMPNQHK